MDMMTVSEVSKAFGVSTRMLRYYEKVGLIKSSHKDDYAYRIYDEDAVRRLQFILVMRKLHISLQQIGLMLNTNEENIVLDILNQNISEIDMDMNSLGSIRSILQALSEKIEYSNHIKSRFDLLEDDNIISISHELRFSKNRIQEERLMNDLRKVNESVIKNLSVRIVQIPPCTVASYHYIGENPEEAVGKVMDKFICESKLYEIKPDSRLFGFNHPNPSEYREHYGYEDWVTIPDDMHVPDPLVKKSFKGGLYAAYTIDFPNFQDWDLIIKWVMESDKYCADYSELGDEIMGGCLEEHLNWVYSSYKRWPENGIDGKVDLLLPIKLK